MALRPDAPNPPADRKAILEAARQDVFMREVDEAVRKDQMANAARRYGVPVGIAVVLGLAGLGGFLWWQSNEHAKAEANAVELTMALDRLEANQVDAALAKAKPLQTSDMAGARVPAQLLEAGIAQQKGDVATAGKLYAAVAADADAPQPLRDLATIRLVQAQYDGMKPADIVARLKPLAVPGDPFFASAGELVAMAYVEQGKNDLAGALFAEISRDKQAPQALRARAMQMAGLLGTDAIDDVDALMTQIERNSAARRQAQLQQQQAASQAGQ